jgi:hypothetical protein
MAGWMVTRPHSFMRGASLQSARRKGKGARNQFGDTQRHRSGTTTYLSTGRSNWHTAITACIVYVGPQPPRSDSLKWLTPPPAHRQKGLFLALTPWPFRYSLSPVYESAVWTGVAFSWRLTTTLPGLIGY